MDNNILGSNIFENIFLVIYPKNCLLYTSDAADE